MQNIYFEIARDFFIEMKYYAIQNCLKKNLAMLDFLILDIDLALSIKRYYLRS